MKRPEATEAEQELYREIRRAIAERRLLPGIKLTEDALASLYEVSRARVRKVLLLLAKDHIVKLEPNRGAFVWHPTVEEARNTLDARRLVEIYLVREAAIHATTEQITKLRSLLIQEANARDEQDNPRMMRLSGEFHMAIAECAANPILSEFLASLVSRSYLILAAYQRRDDKTCPQDDHSRLVDLIEAGDADAAKQALSEHFDHIEAELALVGEEGTEKLDLTKILRRSS